ncbi:MAG: polyprenyl synthetase family protein [Capsulimonadales bacterium]|nr:polyprenyl synthetase family protein [Capsulimonadales bacterium]
MSLSLSAYVRERSVLIVRGLDRYTPPADTPPATLHAAMRYSLLSNGKLMRPLLCVAAAEAVGGAAESVLPTACALEMIHTFSLIHDDLPALDNDDLRRGRPTSHKQFGEAMAILAGDALHTLAFGTIAHHQKASDASTVLRVLRLVADACGQAGMVGGQVDDMYYEKRDDVTPEILRHIHARKTGALVNAAILSGAILSGATSDQEAALQTYGDNLGLAFQIVDDILDVTGDDATLGKPAGSDLKNDKATYPKLFGLERSQQLAQEATDASLAALSTFDERAEPLRAFARFVLEREQ